MDLADKWVARVMGQRVEAIISLREVVNVGALGTYKAFSEPNLLALRLKAQADPDVDEAKVVALLAPIVRDIFAEIDAEEPTAGLTEAEVIEAIGDAFGRAKFSVTPSA